MHYFDESLSYYSWVSNCKHDIWISIIQALLVLDNISQIWLCVFLLQLLANKVLCHEWGLADAYLIWLLFVTQIVVFMYTEQTLSLKID